MSQRIRVGVIGAGVIAQVMHLHYLRELSELFDVVALCDISRETALANAERYHIPKTCTDWRDIVANDEVDAIVVLTSGSHAPIAIAAAQAGKHILVEKPMCFSSAEGLEMAAAAEAAGVVLMVGYPKRYDPAFERFRELAAGVSDPRLLRVTTFEAPFLPYVGHYALTPPAQLPSDVVDKLRAENHEAFVRAIGDAGPELENVFHTMLLDTLVHELNTLRGVLGEPTSLDYVDLQPGQLTCYFKFGTLAVAINWMDLPGITRYGMEFALYGPDQRVTLSFPSPYLRSAPTMVDIVEGVPGTAASREINEITSYESAFKRELEAFHRSVAHGDPVLTGAEDVVRDIALCEAIIRFVQDGLPIPNPSSISPAASH